jgi:hypothetical protein
MIKRLGGVVVIWYSVRPLKPNSGNHLEELVDAPGGDTRPALVSVDGVRLSTAGLPVREYAYVVAIHRRLNQVLGILEHLHTRHFHYRP